MSGKRKKEGGREPYALTSTEIINPDGSTSYGQTLKEGVTRHCMLTLKNGNHMIIGIAYTRVGNVCPGWPVYGVKCLCSRGRE